MGSICAVDSDCGGEQRCTNEVCGRCGDGVAQLGEVCLDAEPAVEVGGVAVVVRPQDLDRDGLLDLVALAPASLELQVLRGSREGFDEAEAVALPIAATALAVGDLDSDGTVDAVVTDGETIQFGSGAGALVFSFGGEAVMWAGATGLEFVFAADAMSTPFVVASRTMSGQTEVVAAEVGDDGQLRLGAATMLPPAMRPIAAGDVVQGGPLEVALVSDTQLVLLSGGELALVAELSFAESVVAVALVDADGDGSRDVVTALSTGDVIVDVGDGVGGFVRQEAIALPRAAAGLAVADLDRDGDRDLFAATGEGVVVAVNQGGRYPEVITLPGPGAASDVLVAELNGDILPEVISVDAETGRIVVLEARP